jgi:hypothetical protein
MKGKTRKHFRTNLTSSPSLSMIQSCLSNGRVYPKNVLIIYAE